MISIIDSRVLDGNSESLGIPVSQLMDNAGKALADALLSEFPESKFAFFCGTGNNGGDGFAAALRIDPDRAKVILLKKASSIRSDISRERYSVLECPIEIYGTHSTEGYDVIVDCVLGTGASGTVKEPYRSCIDEINSSGLKIVSVDVPSGLGSDIAVVPDLTVTFHDVKEGMDGSNSGKILVADIGIPDEASTIVGPGDFLRYPIPNRGSHKGQNGKLMVIGGGPYYGAPVMSSLSAMRTGADYVRLFTPTSSSTIASMFSPVLMVTPTPGNEIGPESVEMLLKESENYDCVLIGPGLGSSSRTIDAVKAVIAGCDRPMVIDADAIRCLGTVTSVSDFAVTPHHREFSSISDGKSVQDTAAKIGGTILLKGPEDVITDGKRTRLNKTGTPAMTSAGTGDVLAGCVAGLMSKGMSSFDACCLGSYMCGKAGEKAFEDMSYGLMATDVIDRIPRVLAENLKS
ncbi:MAG: NAD(P)H-hydrate dehydratase [Candidatus Methanomethylophilaceae archaeon]|nr:NAD(P)H-hydrate dehydratase [Candidatus Methanomethylophilaceae archaeon]